MDYLNIGRDQFPVPGGEDDGRLMCYVNAPYVMQMNMVRFAGVELTINEFPVSVRGKPKLTNKVECTSNQVLAGESVEKAKQSSNGG